ncbi:class 3 adenylate cyclase [Constrictibacter sp. MBR-5]|jgi:class 3 adenylate cyclase|uniref:adenylate/guanylate cyclase domain-containing protein n=1 Tax=Constrictibacter sp. MBR-5 TaxID=3156467 RepID=UPI00339094BB
MAKLHTHGFDWHFAHPPEAVWPALADTGRFNEATGLPKHVIREETQPDGSVRFFAEARVGPLRLAWEDIPVEWVTGRWLRHMRVFSRGPLRRLCASLRLRPDGRGGTDVRYSLEAEAANPLGEILLRTRFFPSAERTFTAAVSTVDEWVAGQREQPFDTKAPPLPAATRGRLTEMVGRIEASGNGHGLAARLADWIATGAEVDLLRIRPLILARLWEAPPRHVVELCLQAVREGMLALRWDLLCPRCRGAKGSTAELDRLPSGAHCDTCNIGYDRDFSRNVELTFHPSAAIRTVPEGEFCLFGPMSTPHVVVQAAVEPGETRTLDADLPAGTYRLRTVEPGGETDVDVGSDGGFPEVGIDADAVAAGAPAPPGTLRIVNRDRRRRIVAIESREWVREALTAHRATTFQAFRDLFSDQVLRPGDEVGIAHVTLMFTDLRGSTALYQRIGDAAAYRLVREHFAFLASTVRRNDGAIVKTIGDAIMAAFPNPADGLRAAQAVQAGVAAFNARSGGAPVVIKLGLHAGPCIAVTMNDRLDYFGSAVNMAARMQHASEGGDIVLSEAIVGDSGVSAMLPRDSLREERRTLKGFAEPVPFFRLVPPATEAA